MGKIENKFDSMKIFTNEKTQGFQRLILFVEIFAIVKRFGFKTFIKTSKKITVKKNGESFKTFYFRWKEFCFNL